MTYIRRFRKTSSGVQILTRGIHRQTGRRSHKPALGKEAKHYLDGNNISVG
jgi:hypothetical protein